MHNTRPVTVPALESWRPPPEGFGGPLSEAPPWGIGVGAGGRGHMPPPLKFGKKIFSVNYHVKFGHFSGKNHAQFGNFVNFSEKYLKIRVFCYFFGQESCKIRAFCQFFIHIFSGKNAVPP